MKTDSWFSFICGYCILVYTGMYKICSILIHNSDGQHAYSNRLSNYCTCSWVIPSRLPLNLCEAIVYVNNHYHYFKLWRAWNLPLTPPTLNGSRTNKSYCLCYKEIPYRYETWRFVIAIDCPGPIYSQYNWSSVHSQFSVMIAFKFILTVSSHLCFCLTHYFRQSGFPVAILHTNTPYPKSKGYR
jgi:hypothetical protein